MNMKQLLGLWAGGALFATFLAAPVIAQTDSEADEAPASETETAPRANDEPDLDDLLGMPEEDRPARRVDDGDSDALDEELDPNEGELERALSAQEVSEMFVQAIKQMGDAADRIERGADAGLNTQRMQEEIIKKLDVLIEQAEQQQSQSSSSSQSQSQSQSQSKQQPSQPQSQKQGQNKEQQGDSSENANLPAGREGDLNDAIDAAPAAWGSLPERVRETLLQGRSDRFSSMYKRLTEEYYRRLAEEDGEQ